MTDLLYKLKSDIKRDLAKATKYTVADNVVTVSVMITIMLSWFYFIFEPAMDHWDVYMQLEETDPVIVLAVGGFILLSLWFCITWLSNSISHWTMRLISWTTGLKE